MSNMKDIKIGKQLHKRAKELAAWSGEKMSVVAERAMTVEIEKMERKRDKAMADAQPAEDK